MKRKLNFCWICSLELKLVSTKSESAQISYRELVESFYWSENKVWMHQNRPITIYDDKADIPLKADQDYHVGINCWYKKCHFSPCIFGTCRLWQSPFLAMEEHILVYWQSCHHLIGIRFWLAQVTFTLKTCSVLGYLANIKLLFKCF